MGSAFSGTTAVPPGAWQGAQNGKCCYTNYPDFNPLLESAQSDHRLAVDNRLSAISINESFGIGFYEIATVGWTGNLRTVMASKSTSVWKSYIIGMRGLYLLMVSRLLKSRQVRHPA